jgi:hypothetical protein
MLDADSLPLINPEQLFHSEPFATSGNLFWPGEPLRTRCFIHTGVLQPTFALSTPACDTLLVCSCAIISDRLMSASAGHISLLPPGWWWEPILHLLVHQWLLCCISGAQKSRSLKTAALMPWLCPADFWGHLSGLLPVDGWQLLHQALLPTLRLYAVLLFCNKISKMWGCDADFWGHLWMNGSFFTKLCCYVSCRCTCCCFMHCCFVCYGDAMQTSGATCGWMAASSPSWARQCPGRRTRASTAQRAGR